MRPLPKIKRILSDSYCLAHIVQVLLTFDPILVEKVAILLCEVIQDNPEISKLYLTGVFYFILMYTGSNLLPIARFLQLTHMKQAFRTDDVSGIFFSILFDHTKFIFFIIISRFLRILCKGQYWVNYCLKLWCVICIITEQKSLPKYFWENTTLQKQYGTPK